MAKKDRSIQYTQKAKPRKNIGKTAGSEAKTGHNIYFDRSFERPKPRLKYMIPEEIRALLAATSKSPRDYAIFRLAYHHGLRASELGMIQMSDYYPAPRMEHDRLMVNRLKGSVSAEVRIVPAAAEAIRRWVKKRGSQPGPMFTSQRRKEISRQRLDELVKFYGKRAGIPEDKRHMHSLRHTCATSLLSEQELDVAQVQNHLGHKSIQSTMIYAQITEAASDARFDKLRSWR
jgi:integrase